MRIGQYNIPQSKIVSTVSVLDADASNRRKKDKALRYLKQISSMIAGRHNVKVHIVEKIRYNAATKNDEIFIRNGDFTDPVYLKLVEGLIDHEAGHLKFSDFIYLKNQHFTPLELTLFNAIEDVRMERLMKDTYPGSISNLQGMCEVLVERGGADYHTQPFMVKFQGYVMMYCRFHFNNDKCMKKHLYMTRESLIDETNSEFIKSLNLILDAVDAVVRCEDISPIIKQLIRLLESQRKEGETNDRDISQEGPKGQANNDERHQTLSISSKNKSDGKVPQVGDETYEKPSGKGISPSQKAPLSISEQIEQGLSADTPYQVSDLHDKARETMNSMASEASQSGCVDCFLTDRQYVTSPELCHSYFDALKSRRLMSKLAPVVKKAFYSLLPKPGEYNHRGNQLAPERFPHAIAGRGTVFKDEPIQKQPVGHIHIAVDCSQSMKGAGEANESPMLAANTAVFSLAKTLYQLPKANVQVDYFFSYKKVCFYRACAFGVKPQSEKFAVKPFGTTPTSEALREGIEQLIRTGNQLERRYLILIVDGDLPSDEEGKHRDALRSMLHLARKLNIIVLCIALSRRDCVAFRESGFMEHECLFVDSAEQLPSAFEKMTKQTIINY